MRPSHPTEAILKAYAFEMSPRRLSDPRDKSGGGRYIQAKASQGGGTLIESANYEALRAAEAHCGGSPEPRKRR